MFRISLGGVGGVLVSFYLKFRWNGLLNVALPRLPQDSARRPAVIGAASESGMRDGWPMCSPALALSRVIGKDAAGSRILEAFMQSSVPQGARPQGGLLPSHRAHCPRVLVGL